MGALAIGALALLRPTRSVRLNYEGQTLELPVEIWTTRVGDDDGWARYIGLGDPSFASTRELEYVEQLGSGHVLHGEHVRVDVVTRKRSRWLTQISLRAQAR